MAFGRQLLQACAKFAQHLEFRTAAHAWCEISSVLPTPYEIFSFVFFDVNSFLILVISQSQALLFKDYKRGGNHLSKLYLYFFTLRKIFLSGRNTEFSLLSFPLFYFSFSWKPNNL